MAMTHHGTVREDPGDLGSDTRGIRTRKKFVVGERAGLFRMRSGTNIFPTSWMPRRIHQVGGFLWRQAEGARDNFCVARHQVAVA